MEEIEVSHRGGSYDILVGKGILREGLASFFSKNKADRLFLVSDDNVFPLYGKKVTAELIDLGMSPAGEFIFRAGEKSKTLETVSKMYEAFGRAELTRKSLVIALGGGVCGDMAGFAAATYLRGMAVLQIPTTLLSQVDSSIGGKTGVDLPWGKNLVGAFHQPSTVICDCDFLSTLPDKYMRDGMGEVIKYGLIYDKTLFDGISEKNISLSEMILRSVKIKAEVCTKDEYESGLRMILNYGHTLGHAIEKLGGFSRFSHGEAVGIGMLFSARIGEALGYTPGLEEKIGEVLRAYGLPFDMDYTAEALVSAISADKKRVGDDISFVLLRDIGDAFFERFPISKIKELIS